MISMLQTSGSSCKTKLCQRNTPGKGPKSNLLQSWEASSTFPLLVERHQFDSQIVVRTRETQYSKPFVESVHNEELEKIHRSQGRIDLCHRGKPTALDVGSELINRGGEDGESVGRGKDPARWADKGCQTTKTGTKSCAHTLNPTPWPFRIMLRRWPVAKAGAAGDEGDTTSYFDPGLDHIWRLRGGFSLGDGRITAGTGKGYARLFDDEWDVFHQLSPGLPPVPRVPVLHPPSVDVSSSC